MVYHPNLQAFEKRLKEILDRVDHTLEERYGQQYRLHPARSPRGSTVNPAHDGLFDITANFTLGIGSRLGKGYVIDIRLVTLDSIPQAIREEILETALAQIDEEIHHAFPDRDIRVARDGPVIKVYGDLSLGKLWE